MLYTVVASRVHVFTHFSLLNETDYQVFCATYVSHHGSEYYSKSKQKWKKMEGKKNKGQALFILRTLCESV